MTRQAATAMAAAAAALSAAAAAGCMDNPFDRPATVVDGSAFPPQLRDVIAPASGFVRGQAAPYYALEPTSGAIGEAVTVIDDRGAELPPCRTRQRNADGVLVDLDRTTCQGRVLRALPDQDGYTPFVRLLNATVPDDYELNSARSFEEVEAVAERMEDAGRVMDLAVIDVRANVVDSTGALPRMAGWFETLELVYLELAGAVPVDADTGTVAPMTMLVPEGSAPGDDGVVFEQRAGDAGYSTLCRVVYFAVPDDFEPGDVKSAADIPVEDRTEPDPPELVHCAVP